MIQDLTMPRAAAAGPMTRLVTPAIMHGARRLLRWTPKGSLIVQLPTGRRLRFGTPDGADEPVLILHNYRVLAKAIGGGAIGFAEAYMDGDIDCDDLTGLFRFFLRNIDRFEGTGRRLFRTRANHRAAHRQRRNSKRGSRRNIAEHYDLGNDFFALWLDEKMNYSSGLYADDRPVTLEDAQIAKHDLLLDLLDPVAGAQVVEIGCGWGAFALKAAQDRGVSVTGITLSQEQLAHARQAAGDAGGEAVSFRLQDYRDVAGQYDHIVSIEMIEAVGEENWPHYFSVLRDRLAPGGSAVIQSITIDERRFERYRSKVDFIQRYIFPGGMLPTKDRIAAHAINAGLQVERVETFGHSYARTLREWRQRFTDQWPHIERLGYDERFRRKWLFYLTYCEAGFLEGAIDVGAYRLVRS